MTGFEFQNDGVLFGADDADVRILRDGLVAFAQGGGVRAGDVRRRRGGWRDDDRQRVALVGDVPVGRDVEDAADGIVCASDLGGSGVWARADDDVFEAWGVC